MGLSDSKGQRAMVRTWLDGGRGWHGRLWLAVSYSWQSLTDDFYREAVACLLKYDPECVITRTGRIAIGDDNAHGDQFLSVFSCLLRCVAICHGLKIHAQHSSEAHGGDDTARKAASQ